MPSLVTITQAKSRFLVAINVGRSDKTIKAYSNALDSFLSMLSSHNLDVSTTSVTELNENHINDFVISTGKLSPATESLYLQVIKNFIEFLAAEDLVSLNVSQVRMLMRNRTRRMKHQASEYPEENIKCLIDAMQNLACEPISDLNPSNTILLRDMRDSALILTLADTGLRVEEVCKLKIGNMDWINSRAILVGRGNKQNLVRFSTRAIKSIRRYLNYRAPVDRKSGRDVSVLPLFARHDKGAGNKIKPITPTTIRNIVSDRVYEILGTEMVGIITPHTFLHYFVTTILRSTGNLKLAQVLARHSNIQVTQKYAHLSDDELDTGYYEIFEKKD